MKTTKTAICRSILALGIAASLSAGCGNSNDTPTETDSATDPLLLGTGCIFENPLDRSYNVTTIDPECTNNTFPRRCTAMVNAVRQRYAEVHEHFLHPTVDWFVSNYDERAVMHAQGAFWRGTAEITQLYSAVVSFAKSANLDFSKNRFSVIDNRTVIAYGNVPGTITLLDGSTVPQDNLPESITWTCNTKAASPSFVILQQHE